ncbi:polysaccharide biosynthesis protein [Methanococcoides methylutens]|uniref:Polysaccharide biosynthesis protein n=1 Tax=Methanococcoides methylutens TaxID=2226 RepID=A0A099T2J5_METMT|nr:polysaccharide biosynthesis C-terminal domain-containing protein [Methanococcoides methylutens]KGK98393.1 polysaccharide biosynthesis protein [Methanococcoides methylutens]
MSNHKLFAQRVGLVGVTNLLLGLSGIILLPILTKNISIEDYGAWAQVLVTIGIVPATVMLGLSYTMVRFLPSAKEREEKQEIFYSIFFLVLIASLVATTLIYAFSSTLASVLFNGDIAIVKILSLIVFIECLNNLFFNYFRATQQIKKYSSLLFIQTCLFLILVAFFIFMGAGLFGALIGLLLKGLIIFLISGYSIVLEIGIKYPRFIYLKEFLIFGLPTIPGNLSSWVVNSSDRYVIGIFLGAAFVGYYSPGYSLGNMIRMFVTPLSFILPAVLSKHYDDNNLREVQTILSYSLKCFLTFSIPAVFGISLLSKPLLTILSTSEIAEQGYLITPFIAVSMLFSGSYSIITQIIIMEKKTKITGIIWILSAALNLGLNFVLIPYIGIIGAAVATLFAFAVCFASTSYFSFKLFKFNIDFVYIFKCLFASLVMCFVIIEFNPSGTFDVLATIAVSVVVYFVLLGLLKGFKKDEIMFFKNMLNP